MQLFRCPFCGTRSEPEFRYVGERGKTRPDDDRRTADATWSAYLYLQRQQKGVVQEVWCHMPCGELFAMERNNVTHEVLSSAALRGGGTPDATASAAAHDLGAS